MTRKAFLTSLILLFSHLTFAQNGILRGTITDKKTRETIVGATVMLEGTTIGASSDLNGEYVINNIRPGTYTAIVSMISYGKVSYPNIHISKDKVTILDVGLAEEALEVQEVVVVDRRTTNTEISIINSIRSTNLIANGVSSQQILKSQDRDASEVIRRIPGITLFDGRFVIVRGLSQRYNGVWLNHASTPSSEADNKAFSFDIIPSSLLENIMVYKTPTASLPADFSGAFIEVKTKNSPSRNFLELSYAISYRETTTGRSFMKYPGGSLDFIGIDDGTRSLPDGFPSSTRFKKLSSSFDLADMMMVTSLGREINKTWSARTTTAIPDNRLSFALARRFRIGKTDVGQITAVNYSNTLQYNRINRLDYQVYNFDEDKSNPNFDFQDDQYTQTAKTSVLFNWSFNLNAKNKIEFQNLLNQIGQSRTIFREGTEYYSSQQIRSYEYGYLSRTTYSGQLRGEHKLRNDRSRWLWTTGYSYSNRHEPNLKRLTTILNTTTSDPNYNRYGVAIGNAASPKYAGIIYQNLSEHIVMGSTDYQNNLIFNDFRPEINSGLYLEYKTRSFDARLLGFMKSNENLFNQELPYMPFDSIFQDKNINMTDGIKLSETTNPSDSYTADNMQIAAYITLKIPITARFNVFAGVRAEKNRQQLSSFSSDLASLPVHYDNDAINLFPSANLTYDLTEKSLIRVAYGQTINRPEFREIAPFNFYVFEENASFTGNPDLKNALIHNFDVRYEYYPSLSELLSFGIFYKRFIDPIEISYLNSGSGLAYKPVNAEGAYSYGAEIELRKNFSAWSGRQFLKIFKDFSLVLNGALIKSQVLFAKGSIERDRYMQGQSPYIINAGLYYQNEKAGLTTSLLYNVLGKRIMVVGQAMQDPQEDIPDIYEMPRHALDFTVSKKIGKHVTLKGGVQDILDQGVKYQQTVKFDKPGEGTVERIQPTLSYKTGRYYTLGISLNF